MFPKKWSRATGNKAVLNIKHVFLKQWHSAACITVIFSFKTPFFVTIDFDIHSWLNLNHTPTDSPLRITLPYKDQKSAYQLRRQLCGLGRKINHPLQPIFTSKKIIDDLRETELKPMLVKQQYVVYEFKCDLCDASYIGSTCRHLHQRVEEHKHSVIGKHFLEKHNLKRRSSRKV